MSNPLEIDEKRDTVWTEQVPALQAFDYAGKSKIDAVNTGHLAELSLQDRQTAWELARRIDPGPRWYSRRGIAFIFYCMVVCVGGADGCEWGASIDREACTNHRAQLSTVPSCHLSSP